jgi:ABC-2 type transport system ATP-binding protein/lipopolysaccharide transport system ATP-binding protein
MRTRLAFAVGAFLEPDVLLADEVLAVGDAEFQQRCLGRMSDVARSGRTVLLVSHDLGAVGGICDRALWLDAGVVRADGPAAEVVGAYLRSGTGPGATEHVPGREHDGPARLHAVRVRDEAGRPQANPRRGEPIFVECDVELEPGLKGVDMAVYLVNASGQRVIDDAWADDPARPALHTLAGRSTVRVALPPMLLPGTYWLWVWLGTHWETFVDEESLRVVVEPHPQDREEHLARRRLVAPAVGWEIHHEVTA